MRITRLPELKPHHLAALNQIITSAPLQAKKNPTHLTHTSPPPQPAPVTRLQLHPLIPGMQRQLQLLRNIQRRVWQRNRHAPILPHKNPLSQNSLTKTRQTAPNSLKSTTIATRSTYRARDLALDAILCPSCSASVLNSRILCTAYPLHTSKTTDTHPIAIPREKKNRSPSPSP